ncbi:MAG: signal peptidase I, partial [Planctomycetota bacterium]
PNPSAESPAKPAPKPGIWRGWIRPLLTVILVVTALRSSLIDWNDVPTGSMIPTVAVGDRIVVNKLAYGLNPPFNGPIVSLPLIPASFPNPLDPLPGAYWSAPQRGDIVTFWKPDTDIQEQPITDGGIRMVKRVVALPGDTVTLTPTTQKFGGRSFRFSKLTLNGEDATYTRHGPYTLVESILGHTRIVQYDRNDPVAMKRHPRGLHPASLSFGPYTVPENQYLMIGDNRDNSADGRFFGGVELSEITGKAKFVAVSFKGSFFRPNWSRFFKSFAPDLDESTED